MEKWLIWCGLNKEQDMLAKIFGDKCVSIQGSTPNDKRVELEEKWSIGDVPILITKPDCYGWGMNWQHCHKMILFGLSDSFESVYQAIRRCWRYGQQFPVDVHVIISDQEGAVLDNIKRKETDFEEMQKEMVANMADINSVEIKGIVKSTTDYDPKTKMVFPNFIK